MATKREKRPPVLQPPPAGSDDRHFFNTAAVGLAVIEDDHLVDANPGMLNLLGYADIDAINHQPFLSHFTDASRPSARELIDTWSSSTPSDPVRLQMCRKDQSSLAVALQCSVSPVADRRRVYLTVRSPGRPPDTDREPKDIETERFEAKMLQAQKMEAVGTLAAGIAHDFNNILWIINGNTELAKAGADDPRTVHYHLQRVEDACMRAKELISQILHFSHQRSDEKKPLIINSLIQESIKLLRASLPTTVEIRQSISPTPYTVMADMSLITQVLMGLCANAAFAMRETGGVLDVGLTDIVLDEEEAASHKDLGPGRYAILSVLDTGKGIAPEVMHRIFDPFFTTKPVDEGTGMGLSVIYGIVKSHGGVITVHSKPGEGAMFHVLLPTVESGSNETALEPLDVMPRGNETILLVDDDVDLLDMGKHLLQRLGYRVVPCSNASDALAYFERNPQGIDLVITDQTMPKITGAQLARQLLERNPDLPIIMCTGFSEVITEDQATSIGIRAFLLKPIEMAKMAVVIREVLEQ